LPPIEDPAVLVGTATADDAAAYRIDEERAIVQTVDFITPIVDTPYEYGQIAAANSLSDVYAMGGRPLFALNIVCFPTQKIPLEVLGQILQGGRDKAREAGIEIVGGHSVEDPEPKYGLVVTGVVPAGKILTNAGAQPGDVLVLTKPLGSGILSTALKRRLLSDSAAQQVTEIMATLNRAAAEALEGLQVHALTDVTGFGLLGHLTEMVDGSGVSARINVSEVPVLDEVEPLVRQSIFPGGATRNLSRVASKIRWDSAIDDETRLILADPQTSGGLLVAIAPEDLDQLLNRLTNASVPACAVIGEITSRSSVTIEVHN
jgi:selenide,water dikinase